MTSTSLAAAQHDQLTETTASSSTLMLEAWTRKRDVRVEGQPTGERESAIERLFSRMGRLYLTKWTHSFKTDRDIRNWALEWSQEFVRHGVTPQMALAALERCSTEYVDWPPNCPQFIAMCRAAIDYEQAFHDAVRQMHKRQMDDPKDPAIWPHAAIYWAAMDFGQFELRQVSYSQAAKRWQKLLDNRLKDGCPDVPQYAPQLAAPARNAEGVAITSEEAKAAARAAFHALLNRKPSSELAVKRARETLARHEAGELLPHAILAHARTTLARLADPATAPDDEEPI
jgi:hypothetical protein